MGDVEEPLSCSLTPDELDDRRTAWRRVGEAVVGGERTEDGFAVRYRRGPGVADTLRTLAAAERDCCGWASWNVTDTGDACVLEVTGPPEQIGPLAAAFGL